MVKFTSRALFVAAGLALVPDLSVAGATLRFIDFQSNCIDLSRGTASTDAPQAAAIGTYTCASRTSATWTTTLTSGNNFNITNVASPTFVLSVAAVGPVAPSSSAPALIDQPALGRVGSAMSWKFVANPNFPNKFNIVSALSPGGVEVALRSYPRRSNVATLTDSLYSPLVLAALNANDPQQAFTLQNV
ncbi:hypothetical protein CVT24_003740 [Panaeolus cyanescens]|uniref:Ricin B lectin domain-containing protein n=1 Tax=Panaeolus cyanescens TaxID=181874 RepID=A0A409YXL0_9AGAR|nr:hypothetical protein CVT24_003740 [Panaeolus cyanescens]